MRPLYINFKFESLEYSDGYYSGRFSSPDQDAYCEFLYDRKNGSLKLYNCSKVPDEILPLPIGWLDKKLRENGRLDPIESRICF